MRPQLEIPVGYSRNRDFFNCFFHARLIQYKQIMFDLGLENVESFMTIRSPSNRDRDVRIQWYNTPDEAKTWLIQQQPEIIFVMTK